MAGGIGPPQDSERRALVGTSQKILLGTEFWKKPQSLVRQSGRGEPGAAPRAYDRLLCALDSALGWRRGWCACTRRRAPCPLRRCWAGRPRRQGFAPPRPHRAPLTAAGDRPRRISYEEKGLWGQCHPARPAIARGIASRAPSLRLWRTPSSTARKTLLTTPTPL